MIVFGRVWCVCVEVNDTRVIRCWTATLGPVITLHNVAKM